MSSSILKPSSKPSRSAPRSQSLPHSKPPSSLPSHLAMVELKSRILTSLSKLSDRDTHQIAVDDLEKIIRSLPADGFPMLLSALLHDPVPSPGDPSGARSSPVVARRESIRLLSLLCSVHPDAAAAHLPKVISLIVRRLKDPVADSSLRDACCDAAGSLAELYIQSDAGGGHGGSSSVAGLFLKPLLEVMGEQSKTVQAGAAMCLSKVVEGGREAGGAAFQRLCPRICKIIGSQNFLAKGSLLTVISNLAQVGAISSQSMPIVLQNVRECLENSDWATRKAAADTLSILSSQSSYLTSEGVSLTISSLEACHFDKVKLVRDSMLDALQLWKKISGKEDGLPKSLKVDESVDVEEKLDDKNCNLNSERPDSANDSSFDSSSNGSESLSSRKCTTLQENTNDLMKIKAPPLKDKKFNPEFFQKLELKTSDDLPVEVVLPRRCNQFSQSKDIEEKVSRGGNPQGISEHPVVSRVGVHGRQQNSDFFARDRWAELSRSRDSKLRAFDPDSTAKFDLEDFSGGHTSIAQTDSHESSFMNSKGTFLGIQRQLSHLERQQSHLMNMLQDFMGGSNDSLITLKDRVHGLERVIEEVARDLSVSSGRRGMMAGFEGSPGRSIDNYNIHQVYAAPKFGRANEGRHPYSERYLSSGDMFFVARGREPRRSDYDRRGHMTGPQRVGILSARKGPISSSAMSNKRAWGKGEVPFRLGEGPSARSVWQASKDEATLEAIRVAGDDNGAAHAATRWPISEADMEAMPDANSGEEDPVWTSWTRAMDSLCNGDVYSAYAEVLSMDDDVLLVKLMERSGPALDEISGEVAAEVLHAVGQLLPEQKLSDITLPWIQQLLHLVTENGADFLGISIDVKRSLLLNLHKASRTVEEPPRADFDGDSVLQLMTQLASAWGIDIQHLID